MASIVLATAYFASAGLGRHVKREVLAELMRKFKVSSATIHRDVEELSTTGYELAALLRNSDFSHLTATSEHGYLIVDRSKRGRTGLHRLAPIGAFDAVFCV